MRKVLEATPNLHIREGMATRVVLSSNGEAEGIETFFGMNFSAKAVVLTTGTFMNGTIWVGRKAMPAGRYPLPAHTRAPLTPLHPASNIRPLCTAQHNELKRTTQPPS